MIDLGDIYPLTVDITDADGHPANATTVTLTITLPDLTTVTPAVSNPSVGRYQCDYPTVQSGRHTARWVATGVNASVYGEIFDVRDAVSQAIISLRQAKKHLNMDLTQTTDDEELREVIEGVTPVVEDVVGAVVVQSYTEVHTGGRLLALHHRPAISLTSLIAVYTGGTSYLPADLDLDGATGIVVRKDSGVFAGRLRVIYTAGRPVVPGNIIEGTKIIVGHAWDTQRGHSGARPGFGDEDLTPTPSGFLVPRRAMEWFRPHAQGPMAA